MAKHARILTDEQRQRREHNRKILLDLLSGTTPEHPSSTQTAGMWLNLERFVVDRTTHQSVPFEGARGVERLMAELAHTYANGLIWQEGHLMGVSGSLAIEGHEERVGLEARVGAGAQLCVEVGPARELSALLDALAVFERHLHLASNAVGRELELVAQGYHPFVSSPSDIVLVSGSQNALLNTYLARTGSTGRAVMRCTAATRLSFSPDACGDLITSYRLLTALAPVLAFLTDNTAALGAGPAAEAPRMARTHLVEQADRTRTGVVSAMLKPSASIETYERWLEGVRPVCFTTDEGVTFSTGTDTLELVMQERDLSPTEAERLAMMAWPWVRLNGRLELAVADALPPRLAGAYAALIKGLMASSDARESAAALVGLDQLDGEAVEAAWQQLRAQGWNARIYGRPARQVADELIALATRNLPDASERRLLEALTQLWEIRCVPRDLLASKQAPHHPRTRDEEAAERWGAGAVIPYDELQGEPPAGSTAVMRLDKLVQRDQS